MGVSPHYRHKWQVGARSWVTYYFDRAGNRQQVTDIANPTINFVINNLNQCNSASGCIIRNRSGHEVSSFQRLYDAQQVNYHYLNDEHPGFGRCRRPLPLFLLRSTGALWCASTERGDYNKNPATPVVRNHRGESRSRTISSRQNCCSGLEKRASAAIRDCDSEIRSRARFNHFNASSTSSL